MYFVEINRKVQSTIFSPPARRLHCNFIMFCFPVILHSSVNMGYTSQVTLCEYIMYVRQVGTTEDLGVPNFMVYFEAYKSF